MLAASAAPVEDFDSDNDMAAVLTECLSARHKLEEGELSDTEAGRVT